MLFQKPSFVPSHGERRWLTLVLTLALALSFAVIAPDMAAARTHALSHAHCAKTRQFGHHRANSRCRTSGRSSTQLAAVYRGAISNGSLQPTGCSGEKLPPKPDGTSWVCSFDDEFSSATGDANSLNTAVWLPQLTSNSDFTSGVAPYQVCYVNSPNNISVSSGALHLTVRKEAAPFSCGGLFNTQYTGGMVSSINSFSQEYGRFEARALLPQTTIAGLQEALWMWPVNDTLYGSWPASGEIDFSEFYSYESSLDIPYIHYNYDSSTVDSATNTNIVTNYCSIPLHQYNAYAVTWSPGNITVTINGKTCLIDNYVPNNGLTSPAPFNQPYFILLTQELGLPYNGNTFNPSTTPLPATLSVDYVRVWK